MLDVAEADAADAAAAAGRAVVVGNDMRFNRVRFSLCDDERRTQCFSVMCGC